MDAATVAILLKQIRRCWLPVDDLKSWEVDFLIRVKLRLEHGQELNPIELDTLNKIEQTYANSTR